MNVGTSGVVPSSGPTIPSPHESRRPTSATALTVRQIYKDGFGSILTSVSCSVCTFGLSQSLLVLFRESCRSPEIQSVISVAIFVVGYWVVYFALRARVQHVLVHAGLVRGLAGTRGSAAAKLLFVCASELFWIVSLGVSNLYLLRLGYSANLSAGLAQWGVNLTIWLPLLPMWEWFALVYLPKAVGGRRDERIKSRL